jgi:hypothetical protein
MLRLGVLCDHALISQDGKLSLIGIFDHIGVTQLPAQHPRFFVVAVLQGETTSEAVEMELAAPDDRALMREQIAIDPQAIAAGSGNLIAEVTMLPLEMTGRYEFRLHAEGSLLGVIPLTVDAVNQSAPLHIVPRA